MSLADALKKAKSGQTVVIDGTVKSGAVSLPAGVNLAGKNNATIDFSQTSGSSGRGITLSGKPGGCRRSSQTAAPAESVRYHHCGLHQYGGKGTAEGVTGDIKESDRRGSSASPHRGYDAFRIGGDHPQKISSHAGRTIQEIIKLNASTHTDGPGIPMIAVSTKTLPEDIAAARNAGINEYLSKPLHPTSMFPVAFMAKL